MEKTTFKKNQHFVPKFYLSRFSLSGLGRELSLYNLSRRLFVQRASLSDQAAKKFYYGKDGELEDSISISEGIFAQVFKDILSTETLPPHQSAKHRQLLHFAVMTESRNPRKKAKLEEIADFIDRYIRFHPKFPDKYRTDTSIKKLDLQTRLGMPLRIIIRAFYSYLIYMQNSLSIRRTFHSLYPIIQLFNTTNFLSKKQKTQ